MSVEDPPTRATDRRTQRHVQSFSTPGNVQAKSSPSSGTMEAQTTPNPDPTTVLKRPASSIAVFAAKCPNTTINSFCGAMAGMASGIVTCPLDVIKTRLQSQGSFRRGGLQRGAHMNKIYSGLFGTARVIWKEDGVRGMYRGLGPMLLGYLPTWAVYMSVYDSSKDYYYKHVGTYSYWLPT
jgi:solute carrier family 25 (mitochondrial folate transporter), member 32